MNIKELDAFIKHGTYNIATLNSLFGAEFIKHALEIATELKAIKENKDDKE